MAIGTLWECQQCIVILFRVYFRGHPLEFTLTNGGHYSCPKPTLPLVSINSRTVNKQNFVLCGCGGCYSGHIYFHFVFNGRPKPKTTEKCSFCISIYSLWCACFYRKHKSEVNEARYRSETLDENPIYPIK